MSHSLTRRTLLIGVALSPLARFCRTEPVHVADVVS